jgi:hypothetical protein
VEKLNPCPCPIADFVLIDLYSQRHSVQKFVLGWSIEEIIDWLTCFGEVYVFDDQPYGKRYSFRSTCGRLAGFWFNDSDGWKILAAN